MEICPAGFFCLDKNTLIKYCKSYNNGCLLYRKK